MNDQPPSATRPKSSALRIIAGAIGGVLVAFLLVIAVEVGSSVVHPFPPDFDGTQEEMCAHVANYPQWVLAVVVPLWALTAFAGTWTAQRIGGRGPALFVGVLLTAGVLFNVAMLPYPIWFKIVCPLAVIAAFLAAIRSRERTRD